MLCEGRYFGFARNTRPLGRLFHTPTSSRSIFVVAEDTPRQTVTKRGYYTVIHQKNERKFVVGAGEVGLTLLASSPLGLVALAPSPRPPSPLERGEWPHPPGPLPRWGRGRAIAGETPASPKCSSPLGQEKPDMARSEEGVDAYCFMFWGRV